MVVDALWYQIGILLASGIEEIELLAPVAVALGLGAVVASWLGLVAFEMAFSAGQTASTRPLWFAFGGSVALSLLGLRRFVSRRIVPRRRRNGVRHGACYGRMRRERGRLMGVQSVCAWSTPLAVAGFL